VKKTTSPLRTLAIVAALSSMGTACMSTNEKDSLEEVDNLVARVERIYVESELVRERAREAVDTLHKIVAPDFEGDPVAAYGEFVDAVERSEAQAAVFSDCIDPMKDSAASVFGQWETDINIFTSAVMRARSEERLQETRGRFEEVVASIDPTATSLGEFNAALRDHVLFLEHDFNPAAVAAIGGEVTSLTEHAEVLDTNLESCLVTTLAYVRSTALPGELVGAQAQTASPE
jgi:hypothetical protein